MSFTTHRIERSQIRAASMVSAFALSLVAPAMAQAFPASFSDAGRGRVTILRPRQLLQPAVPVSSPPELAERRSSPRRPPTLRVQLHPRSATSSARSRGRSASKCPCRLLGTVVCTSGATAGGQANPIHNFTQIETLRSAVVSSTHERTPATPVIQPLRLQITPRSRIGHIVRSI